jgi:hypothetical protein
LGLAGIPFPFRFLPRPPWTILFDDGLGFATTFKEDQYLGTEGREDREEVENWQRLSPYTKATNGSAMVIGLLSNARYREDSRLGVPAALNSLVVRIVRPLDACWIFATFRGASVIFFGKCLAERSGEAYSPSKSVRVNGVNITTTYSMRGASDTR